MTADLVRVNAPSSPFPTRPASSTSRQALAARGVELLSTGGTAKRARATPACR